MEGVKRLVGRVTEFIHYINEKHEPGALVKRSEYAHISFTDRVTDAAKTYRKKRRKEKE
tara:strand:- start:308 stop:484 length:177 start_codon:yes stop_codon:yes gene_type:complete